jgi:5-methylcytosine-specific restriction endonuclease McrA
MTVLPELSQGYIPPRIPLVLLDHYDKYMQTWQWRVMRRKAMKRAKGKCQFCAERKPKVVHHLTYERLFFERLTDLLALCFTCHALMHPGNEGLADRTVDDELLED